MATRSRKRPDEEPEDDEEEEKPRSRSGSSSGAYRMSVTLEPAARKRIRLAAALADLDPNEWARVVLAQAASKTVERSGLG